MIPKGIGPIPSQKNFRAEISKFSTIMRTLLLTYRGRLVDCPTQLFKLEFSFFVFRDKTIRTHQGNQLENQFWAQTFLDRNLGPRIYLTCMSLKPGVFIYSRECMDDTRILVYGAKAGGV